MTDDLAGFLLARIAEDERALPPPIPNHRPHPSAWDAWYSTEYEVIELDEDRWRPECEAKRRIVEVHGLYRFRDGTLYCWTCASFDSEGEPIGSAGYPCKTLRLLALPYAGHPDYRDEWRP